MKNLQELKRKTFTKLFKLLAEGFRVPPKKNGYGADEAERLADYRWNWEGEHYSGGMFLDRKILELVKLLGESIEGEEFNQELEIYLSNNARKNKCPKKFKIYIEQNLEELLQRATDGKISLESDLSAEELAIKKGYSWDLRLSVVDKYNDDRIMCRNYKMLIAFIADKLKKKMTFKNEDEGLYEYNDDYWTFEGRLVEHKHEDGSPVMCHYQENSGWGEIFGDVHHELRFIGFFGEKFTSDREDDVHATINSLIKGKKELNSFWTHLKNFSQLCMNADSSLNVGLLEHCINEGKIYLMSRCGINVRRYIDEDVLMDNYERYLTKKFEAQGYVELDEDFFKSSPHNIKFDCSVSLNDVKESVRWGNDKDTARDHESEIKPFQQRKNSFGQPKYKISVNWSSSRFTQQCAIAHCLAKYLLDEVSLQSSKVTSYNPEDLRGSGEGITTFALRILVPRSLLRRFLEKKGWLCQRFVKQSHFFDRYWHSKDIIEPDVISCLAENFRVSKIVMINRMMLWDEDGPRQNGNYVFS